MYELIQAGNWFVCVILYIYRNAEANLKTAKHKTHLAAMPVADCRLDLHHQHSQGQQQRTGGVASPMGGGGGGGSGVGGVMGGAGSSSDAVGGMMMMGGVGTCDSRRNSPQLYLTDAQADADDPDPDVIPNQYGK